MDMNSVIAQLNGASGGEYQVGQALANLAEAFDFVVVERCPTACAFCDEPLHHAA